MPVHGSLLTAERLTAALPDGRVLFTDLSFSVARERVALIGANGSGKSSLLAALAATRSPTAADGDAAPVVTGRVMHHGTVWYVPQDAADRDLAHRTVADALQLTPALAARDRVLAGSLDGADHDVTATAWDVEARLAKACTDLGLPPLDPSHVLGALSGGEAMRLALVGVLVHRPDVLLLDEPTNHLDAAGRDAVCALVRDFAGAVVVATHDRALLAVVDRIVELGARGVRQYGGGVDVLDAQRDAERDAAARALEVARAERMRARRDAQAAAERQARRTSHGAARARTRGASRIELGGMRESAARTTARTRDAQARRAHDADAALADARARVDDAPDFAPTVPHRAVSAGTTLLRLERVTLTAGDRVLVRDVQVVLRAGERLFVHGPNGSGKTTLLRYIAQAFEAPLARLDQRVLADRPVGTVFDVAARAHPDLPEGALREWLAAMALRADTWRRPAAALSGGERVRLALVRAVHPAHPPAVLLADEPTNHLDVDAQRALGRALATFGGALVVVTHDDALRDAIARDAVSPVRRLDLAPVAPPAAAAGGATTTRRR